MRVHVKLIGSGEEDDPYRVSLPTYSIIDIDYDKGCATVSIPDETHPFSKEDIAAFGKLDHKAGPAVNAMPVEQVGKWHDFLDGTYRERDGEFRPELA